MSILLSILGREQLQERLERLWRDDSSRVYLFWGPQGVGKHSCARAFARLLLCERADPESHPYVCGECPSCHYLEAGTHPDYSEIEPDPKEKTIKTDRIREKVCNDVTLTPRLGRRRVFLINADALNETSQNVLLKTLEEAPPYSYFLLVSSKPETLLPTLRSRSLLLQVDRLQQADAEKLFRLEAGESYNQLTEEQKNFLLVFSEGNPGRALSYLQQEGFWELREELLKALACQRQSGAAGLAAMDQLIQNKENRPLLPSLLLFVWRIFGGVLAGCPTKGLWSAAEKLAVQLKNEGRLSQESLERLRLRVLETLKAQTSNVNEEMVWNRLFMQIRKEFLHA